MKIWLVMLPLAWAASASMAASIESEEALKQSENAKPAAKAPAHYRRVNHGSKHLPGGDIRHCLGLKDNKKVIRCAEQRR